MNKEKLKLLGLRTLLESMQEEKEFREWYVKHKEYRDRVKELIRLTNVARKNGAKR